MELWFRNVIIIHYRCNTRERIYSPGWIQYFKPNRANTLSIKSDYKGWKYELNEKFGVVFLLFLLFLTKQDGFIKWKSIIIWRFGWNFVETRGWKCSPGRRVRAIRYGFGIMMISKVTNEVSCGNIHITYVLSWFRFHRPVSRTWRINVIFKAGFYDVFFNGWICHCPQSYISVDACSTGRRVSGSKHWERWIFNSQLKSGFSTNERTRPIQNPPWIVLINERIIISMEENCNVLFTRPE